MTEATTTPQSRGFALPTWAAVVLKYVLALLLPLVLVLMNARALMTEPFLIIAYNSPVVPADPFGFTKEERLDYAPKALNYLFIDEDISYLGDQTFPDGDPLYNERELKHMVDVKNVTAMLVRVGVSMIALSVIIGGVLAINPGTREHLFDGLLYGSTLTALLIIGGLIAIVTSFNWLFTEFHNLFFEPGTWLFFTSDTLIRLFPTEFWVLAFALMFGGALLEAVAIGGGVLWHRSELTDVH